MESLTRKPTPLTVWMLNRIINGEEQPSVKTKLITLMSSLADRKDLDKDTRESVEGFIAYQRQQAR